MKTLTIRINGYKNTPTKNVLNTFAKKFDVDIDNIKIIPNDPKLPVLENEIVLGQTFETELLRELHEITLELTALRHTQIDLIDILKKNNIKL